MHDASSFTWMSRTEIAGMFSRSECQLSPSSNETQTCVSVAAYSSPFLRGSSRIEFVTAPPRDAVVDLGPRLAAIVRAPEVRIHVVQAQRVGRGIRGLRVEVAGIHIEDARPRLHLPAA